MNFQKALNEALKSDPHAKKDSFLLRAHIYDLVGNNYEAKKAAEEFFCSDVKHNISNTILNAASASKRKKKRQAYKPKPIPPPPDSAYVYFTNEENALHLSSQCPHISSIVLFQACYKHVSDFFGDAPRRVCRRCGDFCPTYPTTFIDKKRFSLYDKWKIGSPVKIITQQSPIREE